MFNQNNNMQTIMYNLQHLKKEKNIHALLLMEKIYLVLIVFLMK